MRSPGLTLGVGSLPGPSGTYGSLVAAAAIAIAAIAGVPVLAAASAAAALGVLLTLSLAPRALRADGVQDPSWIVSDELAGQGVSAALAYAVPASAWAPLAASFVLFRIFDAAKPWPIRALERLPGALGVLADDLGAGLAAGAIVAGSAALHAFEARALAW